MKKKIILSILFIISLTPMLLEQFGTVKGVQAVSGLMNLFNPLGVLSVLLFIIGVWETFGSKKANKILCLLGLCGIVISEIYNFFTWHIYTITGEFSFTTSLNFVFPEFYIGLSASIIMIIVYCFIDKNNKN